MSDKPHQKRVGSIGLTIPPPRYGSPERQREIGKVVAFVDDIVARFPPREGPPPPRHWYLPRTPRL